MDCFPVELWEEIIQNLNTLDWIALATTCRLLSIISQCSLYRKVQIKQIIRHDLIETNLNSRTRRFARTLASRPDVACLVQILKISSAAVYYMPNKVEDKYSSHPILSRLAIFTRLQKVKLSGFHIDADCYTAIHSLPHLQTLILEYCTMDSTLSGKPPVTSGNVISKLSIMSPQSAEGWHLFAPWGLPSLTIDNIDFEDRSLGGLLLSSFRLHGVNKSLTRLRWNHPYIPIQMIRFLEDSPQIREFFLGFPHRLDYSEHVKELSPSALPKLAHFLAAADYTDIFLQGRPVHSVILILDRTTPRDILSVLGRSSVPVTSLELRRSGDDAILVESTLYHAPTTLRRLISHDTVCKGWLESWLRIVHRTPDLREIAFGKCSDVAREDFVHAFSERCPSLRRVTYGDNETWAWREDGTWERCVRW